MKSAGSINGANDKLEILSLNRACKNTSVIVGVGRGGGKEFKSVIP